MKLRVTPQARRHIEAIAEYLNERSPAAAKRAGERIRKTIDLLTALPLVGHQGALAGTREFGVSGFRYIIVYRVDVTEDALVILGIYHGAQRRPGQEKSEVVAPSRYSNSVNYLPDAVGMLAPSPPDTQRVAAVRRFNRFYTQKLGVLQPDWRVESPFSADRGARAVRDSKQRERTHRRPTLAGELAASMRGI